MNIFITGAAKGIGRETALFFAEKGWFVGITDVDGEGLAKVEKELADKPCFPAVMNVTDADDVARTIGEFCRKNDDRLNVLFNNAGLGIIDPFESIPLSSYHALINVNVTGVLNCG